MGIKKLLEKYIKASVAYERKQVLEGKTPYYENQKGKLWYRIEEILEREDTSNTIEEKRQGE